MPWLERQQRKRDAKWRHKYSPFHKTYDERIRKGNFSKAAGENGADVVIEGAEDINRTKLSHAMI